MLKTDGVIDKRTVVDIDNGYIRAAAVVINDDKTYSYITYMDDDDMRTWNNEAEIDATPEEIEAYRKYKNDFRFGDKIKIISGRKMKGEIKTVESRYTYNVGALYQHGNIEYLKFTDGTSVQAKHCVIL